MPRRRFRRGGGGRRKSNVIWDTIDILPASLPLLIIDSTQIRDGAFSSVKRYTDLKDFTVRRTIFDLMGRVTNLGSQVNLDMVLEICVGLSWFDSMSDATGFAVASNIADGTGPLSDADNSRWYARCCIDIPIGQLGAVFGTAAGRSVVVPNQHGPAAWSWWAIGGANAPSNEFGFHCHWDSKAMRRQHGKVSETLQAAFEAETTVIPAAGDDITVAINSFTGRHVLSTR